MVCGWLLSSLNALEDLFRMLSTPLHHLLPAWSILRRLVNTQITHVILHSQMMKVIFKNQCLNVTCFQSELLHGQSFSLKCIGETTL